MTGTGASAKGRPGEWQMASSEWRVASGEWRIGMKPNAQRAQTLAHVLVGEA